MPLNGHFLITVRSQPKHGLLYAACKRHGTVSSFATALGFCSSSVCNWINLRRYPFRAFQPGHDGWTSRLEDSLWAEVGVGLDECWPQEVRAWIDGTRELKSLIFEQTEEVALPRLTGQMAKRLTYEGDQERVVEQKEQGEAIEKVLKTLSYRERKIIELRYGLGEDGHTYTLDEVGHVFKVTRARIRQIENKALRKLQQPYRSQELVGFLD